MDQKRLTLRQVEIIRLLCEEKVNKEIADSLNITVKTVEFHLLRIKQRTNTSSRIGIVKYAIKAGIIAL